VYRVNHVVTPDVVKMSNFEEFLDLHLDRIIETTKNLFFQTNSVCKKCHRKVHSGENKGDFTLRNYFVELINDRNGRCWYTIQEYLEKYKGIKF
jgi:hypothetical protein